MNEKGSRLLLFIEAALIAAPLTLLLLVFIPFSVTGSSPWSIRELRSVWPDMATTAVAVLAAICAAAGWWLIVAYLAGGVSGLRAQHRRWWSLAFGGGIMVVAAVVNALLPASSGHLALSAFRENLNFLLAGAPLLLPLIHVWLEKHFRGTANKPMQATRENARA
jgi:hypothetical protein